MALLVLGGNYLLLGRQPNRLTAAQAENIEQQNKPAITLTPTISQSDSVEDIREIRLRIVVTNVGGAEAELKKLQLVVSDGVPTDDAQQDLYLTQKFFNQRRNIVKDAATTMDVPLKPIAKRHDDYPDLSKLDPTHDCRHGRIFAISNNSPHINWYELKHAGETIETVTVLRPKQSVMHEFVFVLTEYPDQHNRQWLRFHVKAFWQDTKNAGQTAPANGSSPTMACDESEMIVPGLPLSADVPRTVSYNTMPPTSTSRSQVWKADVPTIVPLPRPRQKN